MVPVAEQPHYRPYANMEVNLDNIYHVADKGLESEEECLAFCNKCPSDAAIFVLLCILVKIYDLSSCLPLLIGIQVSESPKCWENITWRKFATPFVNLPHPLCYLRA